MPRVVSSVSSAAAAAASSGSPPAVTISTWNGASAIGQRAAVGVVVLGDDGGDDARRRRGRSGPCPSACRCRRRRGSCTARSRGRRRRGAGRAPRDSGRSAQRPQASPAAAPRRSTSSRARRLAREVEAAHVVVGAIGAGQRARQRGHLEVGPDGHAAPLGTGEADLGAGHLAHHRRRRQRQRARADGRLQLGLVDVAIAAHQRHQRRAIGGVDQRLDEAGRRGPRTEEGHDVGEAALAGRVQLGRAAPSPAAARRPPASSACSAIAA